MLTNSVSLGRRTKAYVHIIALSNGVRQVLPVNPRRVALIIPTTPATALYWSHAGPTPDGFFPTVYMTGLILGLVDQTALPNVIINIDTIGEAIRLPLWLATPGADDTFAGLVEITEDTAYG